MLSWGTNTNWVKVLRSAQALRPGIAPVSELCLLSPSFPPSSFASVKPGCVLALAALVSCILEMEFSDQKPLHFVSPRHCAPSLLVKAGSW